MRENSLDTINSKFIICICFQLLNINDKINIIFQINGGDCRRKNFFKTALTTVAILTATSMISFAGEWKQDNAGWWYQNGDGSYPVSSWKEVNGKQYYFDANGYMLHDTTTPDGYQVGADGAWIVKGVITDRSGTKRSYITGDAAGISIIMLPNVDLETPFVGFMYENKTDHDMIIYGKDAVFQDNISTYYNRRLNLLMKVKFK